MIHLHTWHAFNPYRGLTSLPPNVDYPRTDGVANTVSGELPSPVLLPIVFGIGRDRVVADRDSFAPTRYSDEAHYARQIAMTRVYSTSCDDPQLIS
jgi:hypothetical protein